MLPKWQWPWLPHRASQWLFRNQWVDVTETMFHTVLKQGKTEKATKIQTHILWATLWDSWSASGSKPPPTKATKCKIWCTKIQYVHAGFYFVLFMCNIWWEKKSCCWNKMIFTGSDFRFGLRRILVKKTSSQKIQKQLTIWNVLEGSKFFNRAVFC